MDYNTIFLTELAAGLGLCSVLFGLAYASVRSWSRDFREFNDRLGHVSKSFAQADAALGGVRVNLRHKVSDRELDHWLEMVSMQSMLAKQNRPSVGVRASVKSR